MQFTRTLSIALAAAGLMMGAGESTFAQSQLLIGGANGPQAGTSSTGIAGGSFQIDTTLDTVDFAIEVQSLEGIELGATLRGPAVPGAVGPLLFQLPLGAFKVGRWSYPAHVEGHLLGGLVYLELTSTLFPSGELRGQITPTPDQECHCTVGMVTPCGNPTPLVDFGGCSTSRGYGAYATWLFQGQPSVAMDNLVLRAIDLPSNQFALWFMGQSATQVLFGDGLRCIGGQTYRFAVQQANGVGQIDLGPGIVAQTQAFAAPGRIQAGQTWRFQTWFRDPLGPCGTGFNTTNAMVVRFTP